MSDDATDLPLLDDAEYRRVLCVVAHPDDNEYGTSAAVAAWTDRGVEVSYLLLTGGEAGMPNPPEETRRIRAREQRAACEAVGVSDLEILAHPDGTLVYGLDLRRDVARKIRQFRPDAVVVTTWAEFAPWGPNQADHRVAGQITLDAIRDADNRWVFPELVQDEGLEPWHVSALLIGGDAAPTHAVEVTETAVHRAVASLEAHAEYLAALPDHPAPAEFIPQIARDGGAAAGLDAAIPFRSYAL